METRRDKKKKSNDKKTQTINYFLITIHSFIKQQTTQSITNVDNSGCTCTCTTTDCMTHTH